MVRPEDRTEVTFGFVNAHQALFPIAVMCRVLGVSTSGFYAWRRRPPSARRIQDLELLDLIKRIHTMSGRTYGAPRIMRELRLAHGIGVGQKRVARLMREAGLRGEMRRSFVKTTVSHPDAPVAPDLVEREFSADAPDQLWVADLTYIPVHRGHVYLAMVLDVFSRKVVGWSMGRHKHASLVVGALESACANRRVDSTIHHSDRGSEYTAIAFQEACKRRGIKQSMGSAGDCYDNAMAESFFATLECELIQRNSWSGLADAQRDIFEFIEGWYNTRRRHSSLGYLSPVDFERSFPQASLMTA